MVVVAVVYVNIHFVLMGVGRVVVTLTVPDLIVEGARVVYTVCEIIADAVSVLVGPLIVDVTLTAGVAVIVIVGASGARLNIRGARLADGSKACSDFLWCLFFMAAGMNLCG